MRGVAGDSEYQTFASKGLGSCTAPCFGPSALFLCGVTGEKLLCRFFDWLILDIGIIWWTITSSEASELVGVCDFDVEPMEMVDATQ